jgi:hypothetical protein
LFTHPGAAVAVTDGVAAAVIGVAGAGESVIVAPKFMFFGSTDMAGAAGEV